MEDLFSIVLIMAALFGLIVLCAIPALVIGIIGIKKAEEDVKSGNDSPFLDNTGFVLVVAFLFALFAAVFFALDVIPAVMFP